MNQKRDLEQKKQDFISWTVFLFTIIVVIITMISVIFPAFILGTFEGIPKYPQTIDIFEKGVLFYPFLVVNIIAISLAILHLKNKLSRFVNNIFLKIINYDISRKQALVVVLIILDFYMMFTLQEILLNDTWEDYNRTVKPKLEQ